MTQPPSIWDKINFIIASLLDPCDAPMTIYAKTAGPALLEAILTYYALDAMQMFTSWARPSRAITRLRSRRKGGMGSKSGRWRKKGWLSSVASFDPSDQIGKRLPAGQIMRDRVTPPGVTHLWVVFGAIERLNFWFFFISLILDFFYNWFSALEKTEYCSGVNDVMLLTYQPSQGQFVGNTYIATNCGSVLKIRGPIVHGFNNGSIGQGPASGIVTCNVRNDNDFPATSGLRVRVSDQQGSRDYVSDIGLGPQSTGGNSVSFEVFGPGVYSVQDRCDGAPCYLDELYLNVFGSQRAG